MPVLNLANMPDATIIAHYRATDYTAGSWPDRTANSHDLSQATGANQPALVADGGADFNNEPVVRFDGVNDFLQSGSGLVDGGPFTVIAIEKATLLNATNKVLFEGQTSPNIDPAQILWASDEIVRAIGNLSLTGTTGTEVAVLEIAFAGSSSVIRGEHVKEASGNLSAALIHDGFTLGAQHNGALPWGGDLAEFLIVDGTLTQADRRYLIQYAEQRYKRPIPFPQTEAPTETAFTSLSVNHNVNMPAVVEAGMGLIVPIVSFDGDGFVTPSGWTSLSQGQFAGGTPRFGFFTRLADGTEGGGTVNFQTNSSAFTAAAQCYPVSEWYGALSGIDSGGGNANVTLNSFPNPSTLSVPWSDLRNLWFAVAFASDDAAQFEGSPSNYSGRASTEALGGIGNTNCSLGTARRELEAVSENPSSFELSSNELWVAFTMAVRPVAAVPLGGGAGIMAAAL